MWCQRCVCSSDITHASVIWFAATGCVERDAPALHATVAITLDLYSHATASMHREAASTLDALLRKAPG